MVSPPPVLVGIQERSTNRTIQQSEHPAFATGIASIIGGIIGYARKGSLPSLLGGLLSVLTPVLRP